MPDWRTQRAVALTFACVLMLSKESPGFDRREIQLDKGWTFQRGGIPTGNWKQIAIPSSMQEHEGNDFHGVGIYRVRTPMLVLQSNERLILQFDAVATQATVQWDGNKVAEHLGGWTPFETDVTQWAPGGNGEGDHEIQVRVDERVGHNTQGFLPIIEPHFGGIWQRVKLLVVPETSIDESGLLAWGNPATGQIEIRLPLRGHGAVRRITVRYRLRGTDSWVATDAETHRESNGIWRAEVPVPRFKSWSVDQPNLYDVDVRLLEEDGGDHVLTRSAFRQIEAKEDRILLNGQPLSIRGILNWGYYPPRLAPHLDEPRFRRDLELARSCGFNLMKFCLWVPPRRFLELADEMGILVWLEYPTWHPQLDQAHLPELKQEFAEFFRYDRRYPSAILRSLTCETGSGADLGVVRSLYELAHREIPGGLVEDDSSWIGWNRVHDFYDDHAYGNVQTWESTLAGFKQYIIAHGRKPLLLGEAIAADTWPDSDTLAHRSQPQRPYWIPGFFEALQPWEQRMEQVAGKGGLEHLASDSRLYAMLARKYQIEAYRREVPYGGYVVSVLRDFSTASMGLLDYADQPKWPADQWRWHGDLMLLLKTDHDRRAFVAGEPWQAELLVSHMDLENLKNGRLTVVLEQPDGEPKILETLSKDGIEQSAGTLASVVKIDWRMPQTKRPLHLEVVARLSQGRKNIENRWPIWVVPQAHSKLAPDVWLHPSLSSVMFPGAERRERRPNDKIAVASAFDDQLLDFLEQGGRVLMLLGGGPKSPPLADHWFLRGAPFISGHPLLERIPREFWIELQQFDLSGQVMPDLKGLESVDPIVMLWDDHDLKTVLTHGLLFETKAANGRLLVSSLGLGGKPGANPAGQWVLDALMDHLATGPGPQHALSASDWRHLRAKLHEERIELTQVKWRFKPDRNDEGVKHDWGSTNLALDETWKEINVGQPWDGQGYEGLTGYGWYRINVRVPEEWKGREIYLTFDGVDDSYDLFVDGRLVGTGGDKRKNQTAFDEQITHRMTGLVKPGQESVIAVRVDNWQGAGGIHRPVRLSTCAPDTLVP
jgi:hypothetical protein